MKKGQKHAGPPGSSEARVKRPPPPTKKKEDNPEADGKRLMGLALIFQLIPTGIPQKNARRTKVLRHKRTVTILMGLTKSSAYVACS